MIKAVIFDMYETLVTLYGGLRYMGKQIAEETGISESDFRTIWDPSGEDRTLGRMTFEEVIEKILKRFGHYSEELFSTVVMKRKQSKDECFQRLHPGILPMLEGLKASGFRVGLITNCFFEERDSIRAGILFPFFDALCMSCEMGIKKPDAEIFIRCMDELSVLPQECLYVGDGGAGELEAARKLGMHTLQAMWYLNMGPMRESGRKDGFKQAELPADVLREVEKYSGDGIDLK